MKWADYIFTASSDLFRYGGRSDATAFLKSFVCIPGFKYTFLMRTAKYLKSKGGGFFSVLCGFALFAEPLPVQIRNQHPL